MLTETLSNLVSFNFVYWCFNWWFSVEKIYRETIPMYKTTVTLCGSVLV